MKFLLTKTDRQLGVCLRLLYAEGIREPLHVESAKNKSGKIEVRVFVPVDDERFEALQRSYQTLIS